MKMICLIFIFMVIMPISFGQSIGVSGDKTVDVEIGKELITDFSVSQGSDIYEQIRVEENYDWIEISEKEFILEPKTAKSIEVKVLIKRPGEYVASIKVCASDLNKGAGVLSATVCARHNLKVKAYENFSYIKKDVYIICLTILALALIILFHFFRKRKSYTVY